MFLFIVLVFKFLGKCDVVIEYSSIILEFVVFDLIIDARKPQFMLLIQFFQILSAN